MTVKQLIEKLREYPEDMIVMTGGFDEGDPVEPEVSTLQIERDNQSLKVLMIDQVKWE
jgi:hypothetical protein